MKVYCPSILIQLKYKKCGICIYMLSCFRMKSHSAHAAYNCQSGFFKSDYPAALWPGGWLIVVTQTIYKGQRGCTRRPAWEPHRARGGSGGTRPCDCAAPSLHLTHPSLLQRAAQRAAQIKISRLSPCLQIHLEYGLAQKTVRIANCHYILLRASICVLNYYWSDRLLTVRTQQQLIILYLWWICANSLLAYWQNWR